MLKEILHFSRFAALSLMVACAVTAFADSAQKKAAVEVSPLASPAATRGSDNLSLTTAPDGTVWLSWLETDANDETAFRFSTFDGRTQRWSKARTITKQHDWVANVFDAPQLIVQRGGLITAQWSVAVPDKARDIDTPRAYLSQSTDGGETWSKPRLLTTESDNVEYVSLAALTDGGLLAAWIDGRARKSDADPAQLYARRIDSSKWDVLLDASVCDCCRSSLTALPEGGALLAYRGRTKGEIRDILEARFQNGRWDESRGSTHDDWKIEGCPVNGPRVASNELSVSRVWFTGAGNGPRVLAVNSTDAGNHYSEANRLDLGHPAGRVDTLALHDGSQIVTWLEGKTEDAGAPTAGLYLKKLSAAHAVSAPALLVPLLNDAVGRVFPRIALAKESDATPAQLVVAFTHPGESPRVETLLVTLNREAKP